MHCPKPQLPQQSHDIPVKSDPELKELKELSMNRTTSLFDEDPEKWIQNNIISKNMILKAKFLGRMGLGAKAFKSMSRESIQKCSKYHAREKRQQDEEEASVASTNDSDLEIDRCYSNLEGDFAINFFKRSDDEVRNRYINRLISMKILKLEPSKKHQTMLIFDWDDTLLCTHYLSKLGFVDLPDSVFENLAPVDESASKLLLKAIECGQTFIITNSAEGWVQYSGKLYLPKTYQVIMDKNIKVISARTGYEDVFPGDTHRWKVEAFLDIECLFDKNIVTNLLCLGDSHIEMDAAHVLAQRFSQAMMKTIKFKEKPRPDELVKQQELVRENLEMIYMSTKNHTIRLEKKVQKQNGEDSD